MFNIIIITNELDPVHIIKISRTLIASSRGNRYIYLRKKKPT